MTDLNDKTIRQELVKRFLEAETSVEEERLLQDYYLHTDDGLAPEEEDVRLIILNTAPKGVEVDLSDEKEEEFDRLMTEEKNAEPIRTRKKPSIVIWTASLAAAVVLAFVMVSIKTEERVPVAQQYAKTISTPPPDSRRPEPNGQPHDDEGTTGQASLPETTTAPQEPKLLANNTETPGLTGKTDEEAKQESRLSEHLPTETVTEARGRAATSQPMYVGYPSNVTAANYSSRQGGESHYVPSGNASFVTRIMVNGNEATYFMSSGNSLKILHNEVSDDSVVYKVDGEWVDKEAVEQLSPDSITELQMLERGSAEAIKESKKGRTNDILLITTKRQRAQRQDHSSVPARKSLQISDYDKRNGLYLL